MKKNLLFLGAIGLFASFSFSQTTVELVKDINPTGGTYSTGFTEFKAIDKFVFSANYQESDPELWISDGTIVGTTFLKKINTTGLNTPYWFPLEGFTEYKNKIYFSANDGVHGNELWVTDGTEAGTDLLKDIYLGANGSEPYGFVVYNEKLYFSADDGVNGEELWVTDGTEAGTVLYKDIDPTGSSYPEEFTEYNGKLYFSANDGVNGNELWVTDGTLTGTQMVKDIHPTAGSYPEEFTEYNGKLYFSAKDDVHEYELWVTDGTLTGTQMVKDINPTAGSFPAEFVVYNDKLFFRARDGVHGSELWVTDGTTSGTQMVHDLSVGSDGSYPGGLTVYNNRLYYVAQSVEDDARLYESDGTAAGTVLIEPTNTTQFAPLATPLKPEFFEFKGYLYFSAEFTTIGVELYRLKSEPLVGVQTQEMIAFKAYPNPTKDILTITTEKNASFTLLDLTGKVLQVFEVDQQKEISTATLAPGMYLLKENTSGAQTKIIKQ